MESHWPEGNKGLISRVFSKFSQNRPKSRGDEGNLENFESTSEIYPELPEGTCDYLLIT